MFEALSHLQLQQYWWFIMSVVSSVLVFLLFVQGGQTLVGVLGKTDNEKNMIVNSIGRKWEFTFTTLIVFAAGMFAAFPLWYSVSLGGAYYAWKIFLVCFVLQAVSFEFRRKKGNIFGQKTYDWFLTINGFLGTILLGVVVATFFTGSDFIRNEYNLSQWGSSWYGLDILVSFTNLSLGFAVLFLARTLGAMYIITNIESDDIIRRARKQTLINGAIFTVFFLYFLVRILIKDGYAYNPETGAVFMESYKYLNNYLQMPVALILFLVGVPLVLYGIFITWAKESNRGIWFSGFGTFATVMSIFWILGYNNTAFYPSYDLQSSLTIQNASSSHYTLTAMSYISLFVPVVIAYIYFAWRAVDKTKISEEHMNKESEHHVY
ncbi:cytochrome d ubiquinol oxidase subunit II [Natronoflexus pectinivorans]|uniref:Cytochrome d ubiquinol oxidase subunit II n=1 Tax=Natronoflexus pectinivorans TaxID=682526 RepID=A0A4R2GPC3_9BACT|nr:cytochrome d ubiquinol oxidase subunit II [Natronoflexus pectinivorans]TCO10559.1 cytochrome d ubiquinol oxidase subunit II [Natronoflexus pectinivorans]